MFIEFCLSGPEDWQWFRDMAFIKQLVCQALFQIC